MGIKHSLTLPANHVLTIVCDAITFGHATRLPKPGVQATDFAPLFRNTTTTYGPFGDCRQYILFFNQGNVNFEIDPVDLATQTGEAATEAATIAYVDQEIATRTTPVYVQEAIANRATTTFVTEGLALKADTSYVDTQLALKTTPGYVDTQVALKTSFAYVNDQIATRANRDLSNLTSPGGAIEDVATGILALPATNATAINLILAILRTKGIIST